MAFGVQWDPRKRVRAKLLTVPPERPVGDEAGLAHHWVLYVPAFLCAVLAGFVIVVVPFWSGRFDPVLLGVAIALVAWWLYLRVHLDRFVVTNLRIMRIQGVFNQHTAAMSLSRIVDFSLEEPFAGGLLGAVRLGRFRLGGYGHLVFENAAQDQGLREIRFIPDAEAVDRAIQELVFKAGGGPGKHLPGGDDDDSGGGGGGDDDRGGSGPGGGGSDTDEIPVVRAPLLTVAGHPAQRRRWVVSWPLRRVP